MIERLLIANRGEIARRIARAARSLGIIPVGVYGAPDARALHVRDMDLALPLHGETVASTYLDVEQLAKIAATAGADAVHPGYGFLSESAEFATACREAGLVWVGPPPDVIRTMGSKVDAKRIMAAAGVPVVPGCELPAGASPLELAEEVGYPLLVKASAGGGGRGMRLVATPAELAAAVETARSEAAAYFGSDVVFLERFLEQPRHVEIQILADAHGNVLHLPERECSIQRRHQKVIEESPSVGVSDSLRQRMGEASSAAARAVDYVNAGTLEFLVADDDFWFLEMNTRIQVEHPVTEEVTGIDLVAWQLRIAAGERLTISQAEVAAHGHAIEARLYAEDPRHDFAPTGGRLHRYHIPSVEGLRIDDGVGDGSEITSDYDGMIAKVIAHAPTRVLAAARLASTLTLSQLHGPATNRDLLVRTLRSEPFTKGATYTDLLERNEQLLTPLVAGGDLLAHAVAATLVAQHRRRASAKALRFAPTGWRNVRALGQRVSYRGGGNDISVDYRITGDEVALEVDGAPFSAVMHDVGKDAIDLELSGRRSTYTVHTVDDTHWVNSWLGQSELVEIPRFPDAASAIEAGAIVAPMPGTVTEVHAHEGDAVEAGQVLVVIEAMKMEHRIVASEDGLLARVTVDVGDRVDAHQVLVAFVQEDD